GTRFLRGEPDLWQVLDSLFRARGKPMDVLLEDLAIERWRYDQRSAAPQLAVDGPYRLSDLPVHTEPSDPPIHPGGSAYVLVDTQSRSKGTYLRVWTRGEFGVRWGLTALRLNADGKAIGRVNNPGREGRPERYLVVELSDDTEAVLLITTNLGDRLPDADIATVHARSTRFILDLGPGSDDEPK
ncbi:MAG: hypothetical protein KC416_05950, partial [Myxococcales bacterium]|nr:hypothetical protein [Myxococcales bacterium]